MICLDGVCVVYICLCNALTDTDILMAAAQGARRPREVHEACGCTAQCGSCVKQIVAMLQKTAMLPDAAPVLATAAG